MPISALRNLTPDRVATNISQFREQYVSDWEQWLRTDDARLPSQLASILRKWQAGRGKGNSLRRSMEESAKHAPPYIDDLVHETKIHFSQVKHISIGSFSEFSVEEKNALQSIWNILKRLRQNDIASTVAITKAALLLSKGNLGPAIDSKVRKRIGFPVNSAQDWMTALTEVSRDVIAFESIHRVSLREVAPARFRHLGTGRLYDMAFGPRVA